MMKGKQKNILFHILLSFIWIVGLFMFFEGFGSGGKYSKMVFKPTYFFTGLIIIVLPYCYYLYTRKRNKTFPQLDKFNKAHVANKIKVHNATSNIDLTRVEIENCTFTARKQQNDIINIFYNENNSEIVKTKITAKCKGDFTATITAMTNIDKNILKEIFQNKHTSTLVYFDKYSPKNYYFDLEFLVDLNLKENLK